MCLGQTHQLTSSAPDQVSFSLESSTGRLSKVCVAAAVSAPDSLTVCHCPIRFTALFLMLLLSHSSSVYPHTAVDTPRHMCGIWDT